MNDEHASSGDEYTENPLPKRLSLAEKSRLARKARYEAAKEQKKKYLATPAVQAKINAQKERLKELRKQKSAHLKAKSKAVKNQEKNALKSAIQDARSKKQEERDEELKSMIKPALTLLKGGLSE